MHVAQVCKAPGAWRSGSPWVAQTGNSSHAHNFESGNCPDSEESEQLRMLFFCSAGTKGTHSVPFEAKHCPTGFKRPSKAACRDSTPFDPCQRRR